MLLYEMFILESNEFKAIGKTEFTAGQIEASTKFTKFGGYSYDSGFLHLKGEKVAKLKLRIDGNRLIIDDIEVLRQGQGDGTAAITAIVKRAHSLGFTPALFTDAMRGKSAQTRLRSYYTRLGFILNKGPNKVSGMKEEFYFPIR